MNAKINPTAILICSLKFCFLNFWSLFLFSYSPHKKHTANPLDLGILCGVQAAAAQQEAEKLAEAGKHNDAEAASAAAQRWARRAATAQQ